MWLSKDVTLEETFPNYVISSTHRNWIARICIWLHSYSHIVWFAEWLQPLQRGYTLKKNCKQVLRLPVSHFHSFCCLKLPCQTCPTTDDPFPSNGKISTTNTAALPQETLKTIILHGIE